MTWTWIDDGFTDRLEVMALTDTAFRLHIEALVYCNRNGRDGVLTSADLRRLGHPDTGTMQELAHSGLWDATDDGWQVDWTEQQTSEQVEERRATWRKRDERRRAHNKGDHSLCDPERCWALKADSSLTRESQRETTRDTRPSHSRSLSPSPKEGERGDAEDGSAGATPPRRPGGKCPNGVTNGIARGSARTTNAPASGRTSRAAPRASVMPRGESRPNSPTPGRVGCAMSGRPTMTGRWRRDPGTCAVLWWDQLPRTESNGLHTEVRPVVSTRAFSV